MLFFVFSGANIESFIEITKYFQEKNTNLTKKTTYTMITLQNLGIYTPTDDVLQSKQPKNETKRNGSHDQPLFFGNVL